MRDKLNGVVLGTVKCNERTNIVRIYTDRRGLMAFVVPQGVTAASRMRNAMLMPLSLVEFEATGRPGEDLCRFRDLRRTQPLARIYGDPVKVTIALFVAEVLSHTIQEREQNAQLYNYISTSVRLLDAMERGVANFHICFLYGLGRIMGVEPDTHSYRQGYWFDLEGGTFAPAPTPGGRWVQPAVAAAVNALSRMTWSNLHLFRFSHTERSEVLDAIIEYFHIHHASLGTLRSLDVLKQVFR